MSQPAICSGDHSIPKLWTTVCANAWFATSLLHLGRLAWPHAAECTGFAWYLWCPPLRLISRLTVDGVCPNRPESTSRPRWRARYLLIRPESMRLRPVIIGPEGFHLSRPGIDGSKSRRNQSTCRSHATSGLASSTPTSAPSGYPNGRFWVAFICNTPTAYAMVSVLQRPVEFVA